MPKDTSRTPTANDSNNTAGGAETTQALLTEIEAAYDQMERALEIAYGKLILNAQGNVQAPTAEAPARQKTSGVLVKQIEAERARAIAGLKKQRELALAKLRRAHS